MTEPQPKLSIITPSYNQAHFLERTISSVLHQQYGNLEYLVVDDCSTDGSLGIAQRFAGRLTVLRNERNMGQSMSLNVGFEHATGEIIGWQNSDDVYCPGAFSEAVAFLESHPSVDIVFSNRFTIDESDQVVGDFRYTRFWSVVHQCPDGIAISNQSAFWRRSLFDRIEVSIRL